MSASFKFAVCLLALAAVASPAVARDDHAHDRDNDHHGADWRHDDRHDKDRHDEDDKRGYSHEDRRVFVPGWHAPAYRVLPPRGYSRAPVHGYNYLPTPRWQRGAHYYASGYGPTYVVRNYGYYGLRPPPRGHYWRRSDRGEFLLVAIATGIIADLVLHGGY